MNNFSRNIFLSVSVVSLIFMAFACNPSNKAFSDTNRFIPTDFNPKNCTLLIQKHPANNKYNDRMSVYLSEHYSYKYEIADLNDIKSNSGKYADLKQYPFAVVWNWSSVMSSSPSQNASDLYGRFFDRRTGKIYPLTRSNNIYGADAYKPFFNAITNKFK